MEVIKKEQMAKLQKTFAFYRQDDAFYTSILAKYSNQSDMLEKCQKDILAQIKTDWYQCQIDWFVNYVMQNCQANTPYVSIKSLEQMVTFLNNLNLMMNLDILKFLLNHCSLLKEIFVCIFPTGVEINEERINDLTDNNDVKEILIMYSILQRAEILEDKMSLKTTSGQMSDSVRMYFADIKKIPLLEPEEEKYIVQHLDDPCNFEKLITANLRLVVSVAKRYHAYHLKLEDLIQAGNEGLIRAAQKFDYRKGYRFSTYAEWWIKSKITRCLVESESTIRIPDNLHYRLINFQKKLAAISSEYGVNEEEMSSEFLAEKLNLEVYQVEQMRQYLGERNLLSLDYAYQNENSPEATVEVYMRMDGSARDVEDQVLDSLKYETLYEALHILTPNQLRIVQMRYGLNNTRSYKLQEIADMFGTSRQAIDSSFKRAIAKLSEYYKKK